MGDNISKQLQLVDLQYNQISEVTLGYEYKNELMWDSSWFLLSFDFYDIVYAFSAHNHFWLTLLHVADFSATRYAVRVPQILLSVSLPIKLQNLKGLK